MGRTAGDRIVLSSFCGYLVFLVSQPENVFAAEMAADGSVAVRHIISDDALRHSVGTFSDAADRKYSDSLSVPFGNHLSRFL